MKKTDIQVWSGALTKYSICRTDNSQCYQYQRILINIIFIQLLAIFVHKCIVSNVNMKILLMKVFANRNNVKCTCLIPRAIRVQAGCRLGGSAYWRYVMIDPGAVPHLLWRYGTLQLSNFPISNLRKVQITRTANTVIYLKKPPNFNM
jgi:hypothetical protein